MSEEIYKRIMDGECDGDIDRLFAALKHRQRIVRSLAAIENASTIVSGDKVKLHGLSPKYLNGMIVEVMEIRRSRLTAEIPGRGISTIPLDCVTKI